MESINFGNRNIRHKEGAIMSTPQPPLGIMPRQIWEEKVVRERVAALLDAIERYSKAGQPIPIEWVEELKERTTQQPDA